MNTQTELTQIDAEIAELEAKLAKLTPLTEEFIQAKSIIESHSVFGDGFQSPGYVTLRKWGEQWATHFYNTQDSGFYYGQYWDKLSDAENSFKNRVKKYERLASFAYD